MSNLRDLNQQNPFMDLLAAFNARGADHPFFAAFNPEARDRGHEPPPYQNTNQETPPSSDEDASPPPPPPFGGQGPHHPHHHGPHGLHGIGHRGGHPGRGGWGGRGGFGGPGGRCGPRGFRPWGWGMGNAGGFDFSKLMDFLSQFDPQAGNNNNGDKSGNDSTGGKDFSPEADIFDTEDAFVVHVTLPGAKKEDVGVNWNADSSELSVAGVVYRPGDEAFLKTLALDERKVGVFERKIKLGSKQAPAQVDSDGISAKMEDGILIITIPKTEKGFVEVKKVDIE